MDGAADPSIEKGGAGASGPPVVRVAVGSGNPCKVDAVRSAFQTAFGERARIVVTSHSVPSGVSDQPFGDGETRRGAIHRARAALEAAASSDGEGEGVSEDKRPPPDFAVGLEGGVEEGQDPATEASREGADGTPPALWCMAWMAVLGSDSGTCVLAMADGSPYKPLPSRENSSLRQVWGFARTGSFALPPKVARLVRDGMELGEADDLVFRRVNSKQGSGTVGILTKGMIDRAGYYDHALKLALVPWIRPEIYME